MRQLVLSFLLCFGVVFAMTASPAQVNDEQGGGAKKGTVVQEVTGRPNTPAHHGRDFIKHELKVKKIDAAKLKFPGKTVDFTQNFNNSKKNTKTNDRIVIVPIISDPIDPPVVGPHGGGGIGGLTRDRINNTPVRPRGDY